MRTIIKSLSFLFLTVLIVTGCSKTNTIQFCEGVKPDGEGVNCGKKFEDGELTAVIISEDLFTTKTITVQIDEMKNNKREKVETLTVDVKPDKQTAAVNLSFYTGGKYIVQALNNNVLIGEESVEIIEK